MRTRVKICGITRVEDALAAARAGADAIGLVFHAPSPRAVQPATAREIALRVPAFVSVVGLFVDAPAESVREVLGQVPLDLLQFHGREPPDYCRSFGRRYIKAVAVGPETDPRQAARIYADAAALLLDNARPGVPGGTGETFDWGRIPAGLGMPWVLAGGLGPDNVREAVARLRPWAVDASSKVEQSPGIKDAGLMEAFVDEVMHVHSV